MVRWRLWCWPAAAPSGDDVDVTTFGNVVDEYDAGRPSYPPDVVDALGPIAGLAVLDVGAGTGRATELLVERDASVVAIDVEPEMLRRAVDRMSSLAAVVADGARLPIRRESVDVACFAQSWHWLDPAGRTAEVARVLVPGGRWAAWWSHARADGERWFDDYWTVVEHACPGTHRGQRDTDWGVTVAATDLFAAAERVDVPWVRTVSIDEWMLDQASHTYIAVLPQPRREHVLGALRRILEGRFPGGDVEVRYATWLWTAVRHGRASARQPLVQA